MALFLPIMLGRSPGLELKVPMGCETWDEIRGKRGTSEARAISGVCFPDTPGRHPLHLLSCDNAIAIKIYIELLTLRICSS